ncbi:hypothetical protein Droror1_Dr00026263 [Drosera rotundifolia]
MEATSVDSFGPSLSIALKNQGMLLGERMRIEKIDDGQERLAATRGGWWWLDRVLWWWLWAGQGKEREIKKRTGSREKKIREGEK